MDWKKLGFDNYEEEQFSSRYNAALNVLTDGTTRPYYAAQPIIKEIMENNPTKYGDINEAWSSKGGHADAAKNFIGDLNTDITQVNIKMNIKIWECCIKQINLKMMLKVII